MIIRNKIWNDLLDAKKGAEYLILYISKQRRLRKIFRITTIILSASGIFSALNELPVPAVISFILIGIMQILQSIENEIILTDKDLDCFIKLRLLYNEKIVLLEKLWFDFESKHINEILAKRRLFDIMEFGKKIEELDSSLVINFFKKLDEKAENSTMNYSKKLQ